ncbi:MFS transporter [Nonomuraea ceibae]|uniref:MFS transporter n=1 Tax=Nonomuraea ceibae TaxID=1935170 RepID=UPI001C5DD584|nr:MFS transporter [Nonomuraea ceibae]
MENAEVVRDWRGRSYLVGPVPADRTRMFRLALVAMAAISPLQYGFAALLARDGAGLLLLAACLVFQAAGALPALHLVRRGRLPVRTALAAGAALTATGLLTLALTFPAPTTAAGGAGPAVALLGYAVLGGLGAGAVYGVCSEVVSAWYPDRAASRVSLVTGAFGYGTVPLLVWAGIAPATTPWAFGAAALAAAVAIGVAARRLRLPPRHWWPAAVDPRAHALDAAILRRTPGAVRQFGLAQALRTRALPALAAILACAGAVSVLDVIVVAATGSWGALAVLVALNGAGRAAAMRASEALGRRRVLAAVLAILAAGQLLLLAALHTPAPGPAAAVAPAGGPLLWLGAITAGLGGGAFYPLVASLVREFFGVEKVGEIQAVVYSAKAVAGILAACLALGALTAPGPALLAAAALAALPALATLRLRTPGLPATIPL